MINVTHSILLIAIAVIVTFILRAIPFLIFNEKRTMPEGIKRIADLLPSAIIAVLVIYCLKADLLTLGMGTLASALGVFTVVVLHLWKRNILISIFSGTAIYMVAIHLLPGLM